MRLHVRRLIALALAVAGTGVLVHEADVLRRAELFTVDRRFDVRGEREPPRDLAFVAIDEESFEEIGLRWPEWRRTLHARALVNLKRAGARVIAYDVEFTDPSRRLRDDLALFRAAGRARPVVFATTAVDERGRSDVLGGDDNLREVGARAAQALVPNDPGGVVRRMPWAVDGLDSMAVATVETVTGRPVRRPAGRLWIDFAGPPGTVRTIPFWRAYRGELDAAAVRGRTVVVGPSAPSLQDVHPTSVSDDLPMSGGEIQVNAISTVLRGFPLRDVSGPWNVLAIVLLGALAPLAATRLSVLRVLALAAVAAAGYLVAAQLAFDAGTVLAVAVPLATLGLGTAATVVLNYLTETRERRRLRSLFARFVPEAVVDEVLARTGGDLRLGGVRLEATVLFCDLRGFTAFAEELEAERVIEVLNRYLEEMSEAILDHGGTLVSYMGDGIMAVFGAPLELPDHADRALAAVREMVGVRLPRFNEWLRGAGLRGEFRMGIGLNSGPVMSGNVGSERRVEYTTVGDTTNAAARLEALTKEADVQVLLSDATRRSLRAEADDLRPVGGLALRGRAGEMQVWTLGGP